MAMPFGCVRREVLGDRDEMVLLLPPPARARNARGRGDDDVVDELGSGQRRQGQDRGGRIAARVCDQLGGSDNAFADWYRGTVPK